MALRVKAVLEDRGIGPSELARRLGRSKTTWSRWLDGERDIQSGDPRAEVGTLLEELEIEPGPALWEEDQVEPEMGASKPPEEIVMQGQYLSEVAQKHFGLFRNPFDPEAIRVGGGEDRLQDLYLPPSHKFVEARIRQALTTAGFIALYGEPGSGKSTLLDLAVRRASEAVQVVRVTPANVERRKLSAAHISAEIIRQLSEERVPRMANVRDARAKEVLGKRYEQGQRVSLVVDEAHELPTNTIKDLKRFHELRYGYAQLLAIVLVGQTELRSRFDEERNYRLREAIIRCQLVVLGPMAGHVAGYLARRFEWVGADVEKVFEPDAIEAMDARLGVHDQQYPVIIGNVATAAMNIAAKRGFPRVTEEDVEAVWAATPEDLQQLGL